MVIAIIGESCTGKSTLAERLQKQLNAEVFTGKDYLRLAKNEAIAKKLFAQKLAQAVTGGHVIYVIAEKEHLPLLPDGAIRILVTADLDTIQARFAQRMRGSLPAPVAAMLEKKHGCFDIEPHDIHMISGESNVDDVCKAVLAKSMQVATAAYSQKLTVQIDRPMGSRHPNHPDILYPVNYGFVPGIPAPDGEAQDVYILGVDRAVESFTGVLIAIIHRKNDVEDKWVVAPEGMTYTKEEIAAATAFQEQFFDIEIELL